MTRVFQHRKFNRNQRGGPRRFIKKQSGHEIMDAIHAMQSAKKTAAPIAEAQSVHVSFNEFSLDSHLETNIAFKGYQQPTPIQDKAIPAILAGKDVIGIANTGTGKTAAFLIPLIHFLSVDRSERIFILAPTRELAIQIYEELRAFSYGIQIQSALCIGGANIQRQKIALRQSPHVVIGTPGRIKDLIRSRSLDLSQFNRVVLDEADRMVDIGFIHDIKYFISLLPKKRQSLFFSATIDGKVREVLQNFVQDPVTVSVKQQNNTDLIKQEFVRLNGFNKIDTLHNLLIQPGFDKVLVFGRTKWGMQKLTDELMRRGLRVGVIHGNKRQSQRQRVLEQFKKDEIQIMLATDVASRGLDIQGVTHVINYEMPESLDDYIHRIGRTGRANQKGTALTFVE